MKLLIPILLIIAISSCTVLNKHPVYSNRDNLIIQYTDSAAYASIRGRKDSSDYWFGVALNVDSIIVNRLK